jgi:DNA-binding HxlR family transcriptional regulator
MVEKLSDDRSLLEKVAQDEEYANVAATLKVIEGKWKALLIWVICEGHVRFNELRRLIPEISQKMLAQQLKELEQEGLIYREVYPETPPKVEYSLTEYGRTMEPVFEAMCDWGSVHRRRGVSQTGRREETT